MHRLLILALILAALVGPAAAVAAPAPPAPSSAPARVVAPAVFADDVRAFGAVMSRFAEHLRAASRGPAAMRRGAALLRRDLRAVGAMGRRMAGYRVASPDLERRRRAMALLLARVATQGNVLVDAALAGDDRRTRAAAQRLVRTLAAVRAAMGT
ncbi:MAG TPA: hypothetical protein VNT51_02665 [Miltoncostaeaceae bacterium]|nr:hypothetical protein [Miltoncostaeaceae bacterium]